MAFKHIKTFQIHSKSEKYKLNNTDLLLITYQFGEN